LKSRRTSFFDWNSIIDRREELNSSVRKPQFCGREESVHLLYLKK
jgi:hypothetical protein